MAQKRRIHSANLPRKSARVFGHETQASHEDGDSFLAVATDEDSPATIPCLRIKTITPNGLVTDNGRKTSTCQRKWSPRHDA